MRAPLLRTLIICGLPLLCACDPSSSRTPRAAAQPVGGSATTVAGSQPSSVGQILALEANPAGRATLSAWTRDPATPAELRVAALRRLEELKAPETVQVASDVARPAAPRLLRENAVAVLVRAKTPEGEAAIRSLDADAQALARSLGGGA